MYCIKNYRYNPKQDRHILISKMSSNLKNGYPPCSVILLAMSILQNPLATPPSLFGNKILPKTGNGITELHEVTCIAFKK